MILSRRQILKAVPVLAGAALLSTTFPLQLFSATPANRFLVVGCGPAAAIVNLSSGRMQRMRLGFMPHSFIHHPHNPDRVWAVERWDYIKPAHLTESIAEIDLHEGVLRQYASPAGSGFFGHGFFTPDGKVLFISRVDLERGQGYLTGYDIADMKEVASYPLMPGAVHEVRTMADGTALAVCSGIRPDPVKGHVNGPRVGKGTLVHFDPQQGKIFDKKPVGPDTQMVGHCGLTKDGGVIVLSRPRPTAKENGGIYISRDGQEPFRTVAWTAEVPAGEPSECLSIAVNEEDHMAIITNVPNERSTAKLEKSSLFVMDTRKGEFVRKIDRQAYGVVFDPQSRQFFASGATLSQIDEKATRGQDWVGPLGVLTPSSAFNSPHSLLI